MRIKNRSFEEVLKIPSRKPKKPLLSDECNGFSRAFGSNAVFAKLITILHYFVDKSHQVFSQVSVFY